MRKRKPVPAQYEDRYGPIWGRRLLSFKNSVARTDRRLYEALRRAYYLFKSLVLQHLATMKPMPIEEV